MLDGRTSLQCFVHLFVIVQQPCMAPSCAPTSPSCCSVHAIAKDEWSNGNPHLHKRLCDPIPKLLAKRVQTACSLPASQASSALLCSVLFFFGILNDRPRFRQTHKEGCRFGRSCLLQLHSAETLECQSAKASSMPIDRSQKVKKKKAGT